MTKPKVYVTRMIAQEALDMIAQVAEVKVWSEELPPPRESLLEEVWDVDSLLTLLTDTIDASVM